MKISKLLRLFLTLGFPLLLVVAFVAVAQPAYAANPNVIFAQCANGSNGEDPTCTGSGNNGWVTGKVGPSKANYQVGDFIAYRGVHTNLIVGNNYCFGMWWDVAKDVLPNFDNEVILLTANVLPAVIDAERMLVAIRVKKLHMAYS